MSESDICPVCQTMAKMRPLGRRDCIGIECPRCGVYFFFPALDLQQVGKRVSEQHLRKAVSTWIREQNLLGQHPVLDISLVEKAIAVPQPGFIERSRRLLFACGRMTQFYSETVELKPSLMAITWSDDEAEVNTLGILLHDQGFLDLTGAGFALTARGISEVEAERSRVVSDQVFVAMSFDSAVRSVYDNGLYPGIHGAGYKPFRVDRHDHVNRIDDEIIAQIRRSRFVVADFTGQKHGVYFEAGFALGLALQVIWSCRKDDIKNLHFDIRQYNCIDWDSETELAERLKLRIEAVMGVGPNT
jgi:hypothetical protein